MRLLWLVLLAGALAAAQYGPCTATGVVVQEGSGQGVPRARLLFTPATRPGSVTLGYFTDDEGRFEAFGLEPASYSLSVQKTGFADTSRDAAGGGDEPLRLGGRCDVKGLQYVLAPAAVISGRILDRNGVPQGITSVDALRRGWLNGRWQFRKVASALSDGQGRYRIARVPMGTYVLRVHPPAPVTVKYGEGSGFTQVSAPAYYPGVYESSKAQLIHVRGPGEMGGFDFGPLMTQLLRVEGRVTGLEGQMVPQQCRVALRPSDLTDAREYLAGCQPESGNFAFAEIPPGSYHLNAYAADAENVASAVRELDLQGSDVTGLTLAMEPPSTVRGRAILTGGAPPPNGAWLKLKPVSAAPAIDDASPIGAGGQLEFSMVLHDRYRLSAGSNQSNLYLQSVLADGKPVEGTLLDWTAHPPDRLEVVLGQDGGSVEGVVRGAFTQPVRGFYVVLVPADMSKLAGAELLTQPTQTNGAFQITNVPPGDYYAYSFAFLARDRVNDPAMLSDPLWVPGYRGQPAALHVAPYGSTKIDLPPQPLP
ncbi:MAG: carboxypeptidase regulatory-like domain-containing protein [Acidobacteria bacterium]|nr:carboxypeptidase regulatory-like domain-containing protein [Acidobacteriota bacterium]